MAGSAAGQHDGLNIMLVQRHGRQQVLRFRAICEQTPRRDPLRKGVKFDVRQTLSLPLRWHHTLMHHFIKQAFFRLIEVNDLPRFPPLKQPTPRA